MQEGKIVEQGTVNQVLKNPSHEYTKMLIGSVPSMKPPKRDQVSGNPALIIKQINKTFGGLGFFGDGRKVHAAKSVSFDIRAGETTGIVGESGSGKSTVARCVIRLIDPNSGKILINNIDVAKLKESKLRPLRNNFQIVFQDPYRSLNPRRTVGQSIIEGPTNFGIPLAEATQRAKDLMNIVGLQTDSLERFPHQFSGGQRQRICIARALAMEPQILIADEAVSALDVSVQAQVLELLDDVKKKFDLAMLFITHDLRVAAQVCDNIVVMREGEIVERGSTYEIYSKPKHSYTKALLDAAPGHKFFSG
tara:strand:- start:579 stop:1499 length:921 start_codon:yes stop_codon:yes gene_type:complete